MQSAKQLPPAFRKSLIYKRNFAWNGNCSNSSHGRFSLYRNHSSLFRRGLRLRMGVQPFMSSWELILGGAMALALTVYLVYAMLRPEKF